ncbi:vWA domain-containing protein [Candidatus Liberibacter solanacearum]|uniref:VWFA domain-containing protein n=1 Tax=Candidatus Liberibacter solanacearum TaxID=556287 RepID=A0A1V2N9B9_9HYPH|nr:vWA domain-containing protein [Candidatus Liberibacter solanacearum]ONI60245.1 hypothetical protein AYO25_00890 [Candidatus Liberibacter solanacearum]
MSSFDTQKFLRNNTGSIAIFTVFVLSCSLVAILMAIELSHIFFVKTELNAILNHSLMYTAQHVVMDSYNGKSTDIHHVWENDFRKELQESGFEQDVDDVVRSTSLNIIAGSGKHDYNISATSKYKIPFKIYNAIHQGGHYGYTIMLLTRSVVIDHDFEGIDMMIVLDVSDSMTDHMSWFDFFTNNRTRLYVAKRSINELLNKISLIPDVNNVVRSGMVTFDSSIKQTFPLAWGIKNLQKGIENIKIGMATNSTYALKYAYDTIFSDKELHAHQTKKRSEYKKYIIFVTDGSNTRPQNDIDSLYYCNKAKKEGAMIYAIGIQTTDRANNFLWACSSPNGYHRIEYSKSMYDLFSNIGKDMNKKRLWYNR